MDYCLPLQESSVAYNITMENGHQVRLHAYIVYDTAREVAASAGPPSPEASDKQRYYEWICASRSQCTKSCKGQILAPMKRVGPARNPSSLHLAIDEASNHIGVRAFRSAGILRHAHALSLALTEKLQQMMPIRMLQDCCRVDHI